MSNFYFYVGSIVFCKKISENERHCKLDNECDEEEEILAVICGWSSNSCTRAVHFSLTIRSLVNRNTHLLLNI